MNFELKRGDTFRITLRTPDRVVSHASSINAGRGQVRAYFSSGLKIAELDFEWAEPSREFYSVSTQETQNWPLGPHVFDVEFTLPNGDVVSSETQVVTALDDVTKPDDLEPIDLPVTLTPDERNMVNSSITKSEQVMDAISELVGLIELIQIGGLDNLPLSQNSENIIERREDGLFAAPKLAIADW